MDRFDILWGGYLNGSLSSAEEQELFDLLDSEETRFSHQITELLHAGKKGLSLPGDDVLLFEAIQRRLQSPLKQRSMQRLTWMHRWGWVAAAILLIAGVGAYRWLADQRSAKNTILAQQPADIAPGKTGALLTLADGSQISLDTIAAGVVALQGGVKAKVQDGRLLYEGTSKDVVYNTMSTPSGRQYPLTLPDGTKVWLNAESSIRYPTVFNGQDRKVTITGEVFLEVAAHKSKPFIVTTPSMEVQVLGTSFNINAYSDEPKHTATLYNGSIKVLKKLMPQKELILQPGQQAVVNEHITLQQAPNLEQTIAWKNGVFNLTGTSLEAFMRQVARWYGITVVYSGEIPKETFKGKLGRDLQLSQILKVLTLYNIKYQLSGKTITIEP